MHHLLILSIIDNYQLYTFTITCQEG